MIDVIKIASYICKRYRDELNTSIDEMKLHKLLYFSQRESIIQTGEPMFQAQFAAWKYGPVLVQVREGYRANTLNLMPSDEELSSYMGVLDYVFLHYAKKDSWTLSLLTHGESCWQKARIGCDVEEHCDELISIDNLRKDAERMKLRRFYFEEVVPKLKEK